MRQGDLVVARFDDSVVVGMIIGRGERTAVPKHEQVFVYVDGKTLVSAQLSNKRFIQVRLIFPHSVMGFFNLCDITLGKVVAYKPDDGEKLSKWEADIKSAL